MNASKASGGPRWTPSSIIEPQHAKTRVARAFVWNVIGLSATFCTALSFGLAGMSCAKSDPTQSGSDYENDALARTLAGHPDERTFAVGSALDAQLTGQEAEYLYNLDWKKLTGRSFFADPVLRKSLAIVDSVVFSNRGLGLRPKDSAASCSSAESRAGDAVAEDADLLSEANAAVATCIKKVVGISGSTGRAVTGGNVCGDALRKVLKRILTPPNLVGERTGNLSTGFFYSGLSSELSDIFTSCTPVVDDLADPAGFQRLCELRGGIFTGHGCEEPPVRQDAGVTGPSDATSDPDAGVIDADSAIPLNADASGPDAGASDGGDGGQVRDSGVNPDAGIGDTGDGGQVGDTGDGGQVGGYVRIPAGTFMMGAPSDECGYSCNAHPETQHSVTITRDFWLKQTEVTQEEWRSVMGRNPSHFAACGDSCPVEMVSWWDAVAYVNELSAVDGLQACYTTSGCTGTLSGGCSNNADWCIGYRCEVVTFVGLDCTGYRLPTEAEWEYAARAGTTTAFYTGDWPDQLADHCGLEPLLDSAGWYCGNSGSTPHPVAAKAPNDWGLYDMHGNVWEWTYDGYFDYSSWPATDPLVGFGTDRVLRGGSYGNHSEDLRSAARIHSPPAYRMSAGGLRPARSIP